MWKIRKLDEQLFDGAAAKIHEFLDIELLMPPGRLRLSKLLGRAMVKHIECDCVGWAFQNECRNIDCYISGLGCSPRYVRWASHASVTPNLTSVTIMTHEDREFGEAWYAKHECCWPDTVDGIHPMIERLIRPPPTEWLQEVRYTAESEYPVKEGYCGVCATKIIDEESDESEDESDE